MHDRAQRCGILGASFLRFRAEHHGTDFMQFVAEPVFRHHHTLTGELGSKRFILSPGIITEDGGVSHLGQLEESLRGSPSPPLSRHVGRVT